MEISKSAKRLAANKQLVLDTVLKIPGRKLMELRADVAPVVLIDRVEMHKILLELFEAKLVSRKGKKHTGYTYYPRTESL